jgi:hypothetical protein
MEKARPSITVAVLDANIIRIIAHMHCLERLLRRPRCLVCDTNFNKAERERDA